MARPTGTDGPATLGGARPWLAAVAVVLLVVACVAALGLHHYEQTSRASMLARFDQKVAQGAGFVEVYLEELSDRAQLIASRQLGGGPVDDGDVAATAADLGVPLAVLLDDAGRLLAAHPPREDLTGRDLAGAYAHLSEAVAGRRAVSDVVPGAGLGEPVVGFAVPYDTPEGRRVFSLAFRPGATPLEDYLEDLLPVTDVHTYLLDSQGNVLLGPGGARDGTPVAAVPDLRSALSDRTSASGSYAVGGQDRHYAVEPVEGTRWVLLSTVPTASIMGPLGPSLWLGRSGLVLLVVAVVGAICLLWRIAERDRRLQVVNRRLDEALQLRSMFIDVASHELRTPLTVSHGFIATLAERWSDLSDDRRFTLVEGARRHSDRLVGLVEDVLEMSRLQEGRTVVTRGRVPAARVVRDAIATSVLGGTAIDVVCPEHVSVSADPVAAQRIVRNLLDNAARYGRPPVAVSVRSDGDVVRFAVTDAGAGVPEEFVPHMFEPFAQAGAVENHRDGSGLGLAIAHGLAAEMGGELVYRRTGALTTFELTLPVHGGSGAGGDGHDAGLQALLDEASADAAVLTR